MNPVSDPSNNKSILLDENFGVMHTRIGMLEDDKYGPSFH